MMMSLYSRLARKSRKIFAYSLCFDPL